MIRNKENEGSKLQSGVLRRAINAWVADASLTEFIETG